MSISKNTRGLLGTKLGMTQTWDENNRVVPVTVIQAGPCVVTEVRTSDSHGYDGVQIAFGDIDPRKVNKPMRGHFEKAGVTPRRHLLELRTADASEYSLGQEISAEAFAAGEIVDVSATSKGKGFAGVMKRHGFDRRLRHPRPGLQGPQDGRPDGQREGHHAERDGPRDRHRARPDPAQGRRPRSQGRPRADPQRREGSHQMSTVDVVVVKGDKVSKEGSVELPAELFDVQVNIPLIHQVVVAQLAAARQGTHKVKTRAEVRGGGAKPYRQKGTGRARQGSTRAPQFTGGGVVHGPTPRDYSQRTPKKMIAAALRGSLSDRARDGRVHVVEQFVDGDKPSTKVALKVLAEVTDRQKALVVVDRNEELTWLSLRNVPTLHLIAADQLNAYDVLCSDDVIFTRAAFDAFVAGAPKGKSVKAVATESEASEQESEVESA
jgi:large subunit ribosomal protein L4